MKVGVTSPANEINDITSGECFFACFNMSGCYTFSYADENGPCLLYTGCGASCALITHSAFTTYVRECAATTITGSMLHLTTL